MANLQKGGKERKIIPNLIQGELPYSLLVLRRGAGFEGGERRGEIFHWRAEAFFLRRKGKKEGLILFEEAF